MSVRACDASEGQVEGVVEGWDCQCEGEGVCVQSNDGRVAVVSLNGRGIGEVFC